MAALAEELGAFVAGFRLNERPRRTELVELAQVHVLDALGVALAATTMVDGAPGALLALAPAPSASTGTPR